MVFPREREVDLSIESWNRIELQNQVFPREREVDLSLYSSR